MEERLPGCQVIGSYRSSLEGFALSFASDYSAGVHADALEKLYPGTIHYDRFGQRFVSFGNVKDDDVKQLVSSGKCVLMETTPLDASVVNRFVRNSIHLAVLMTVANPIIPSEATTLYRLQPLSPP